MLACVDVGYGATGAIAACVLFESWSDPVARAQVTASIAHVEPYVPGEFFRRELPCLLAVIAKVDVPLAAIVVDGFVWLGAGKPGLGAHLYEALGERVPIIGVAKTAFRGDDTSRPLMRGRSARPLHLTAIGVPIDQAEAYVGMMHGDHRIPTLLAVVDRLSRTG